MLFQKNDTVLFIGDSISDYERKRPVGEGLRNAWGTSYVACAGALLGSVYPELALRVINMGVSGNQTRDTDRPLANGCNGSAPGLGVHAHWHQRCLAAIRSAANARNARFAQTNMRATANR